MKIEQMKIEQMKIEQIEIEQIKVEQMEIQLINRVYTDVLLPFKIRVSSQSISPQIGLLNVSRSLVGFN